MVSALIADDLHLVMRCLPLPSETPKDDIRNLEFYLVSKKGSHHVATKVKKQMFYASPDGKILTIKLHITTHSINYEGNNIPVVQPMSDVGYVQLFEGKSVQLGEDQEIDFNEFKNLEKIRVSYLVNGEYNPTLFVGDTYEIVVSRDGKGKAVFDNQVLGVFRLGRSS